MKNYIGWAVGKGYAVIDVNIPKHVTIEPVSIMDFSYDVPR
jgi:histone deacetylase 6